MAATFKVQERHPYFEISKAEKAQSIFFFLFPGTTSSSLPTDKVRFILGGEENDESHKMFTELAIFQCDKDGNEEWREMARWLKFEEAVEEGGDRWSKPHVGTLSLYSLFELRSSLLSGTVLLDMNASNLTQIAGECQENNFIIVVIKEKWVCVFCYCLILYVLFLLCQRSFA